MKQWIWNFLQNLSDCNITRDVLLYSHTRIMVYTIPAPDTPLVLDARKEYMYITKCRECYAARGEEVGGQIRYTADLILSLVLSYLAPFRPQCMIGAREAQFRPSSTEKSPEELGQGILATVLASLMTLAKPVTTQNIPAYAKRWQAALAAQFIPDMVAGSSWTGITGLGTRFLAVVTGREELRVEIVDRVLSLEKTGAEGAVLAQVKLVWEYASLKAVQYMDHFVKSHCRALEIPAVLDQALDLKS